MNTFTALLALLAASCAFAATAHADPTADVIGGTDVSQSDYTTNHSYMVGLLVDQTLGHQFCAGSLIAPTWVMTAAHCYVPEDGIVPRFVHIGSEDMLTGGEVIPVISSFLHPAWNPDLLRNDVQLLKLGAPPSVGTPVVRSTLAEDPVGGEVATLLGWGKTSAGTAGQVSRFLKSASVDVIDQSTCETDWNFGTLPGNEIVTDRQICAIHFGATAPEARMACNGDSGGPLLFGAKVIGIASFVHDACSRALPNVYTRVSEFNTWIDGVIAKSVSPEAASVDFGSAQVGGAAAERTIKFRSDGSQPVNVGGAVATGDYSVKSSTCSGAVPAGGFCQVIVAFAPTEVGTREGQLTINSDSPAGTTTQVSLGGLATARAASPVTLRLTLPRASKVKGSKLTAKFRVSYDFPAISTLPAVCTGSVRLSLKVPKIKKRVVGKASMKWTPSGCAATIKTSMSKAAKRMKATASVSFAGNDTVLAGQLKQRIRIR